MSRKGKLASSQFRSFVQPGMRKILIIIILHVLESCSMHKLKNNPHAKIIYYNDTLARQCPKTNKVVLVGGCFDILHYGHIEFLRKAKEQGDHLIVALEPDESIMNYKHRHPIHNQLQRAEILSSLHFVDEVLLLPTLHGFNDYNKLVQYINPQVIAVTKGDSQTQNKRIQAESIGAMVVEVTDLVSNQKGEILSSSSIIHH